MEGDEVVAEGNGRAVYCDVESQIACELLTIDVAVSNSSAETLPGGAVVWSLGVPMYPDTFPQFIVNGLDAESGSIAKVNSYESGSEGQLTVEWDDTTFEFDARWPALSVTRREDGTQEQIIDVFSIDAHTCDATLALNDEGTGFRLWMGDVDRDNLPDLFIRANGAGA